MNKKYIILVITLMLICIIGLDVYYYGVWSLIKSILLIAVMLILAIRLIVFRD
jgi:hypothetical protein